MHAFKMNALSQINYNFEIILLKTCIRNLNINFVANENLIYFKLLNDSFFISEN